MVREERRYKISEVAAAVGRSRSALYQRMRKRQIPTNRKGYTMDEVKTILRRLPMARINKASIRELRQTLKNDGYL